MTQIARVVIYYVDGTYQECVQGNWNVAVPPGPLQPPSIPDIYKIPGEAGKWPWPPADTGISILD